MDSSFLVTIVVAATIGFLFIILKKLRFHQDKFDDVDSSPHAPSSDDVSPLPYSCTHQVFPSFHGADVRKDFLSHILKEFKRKGIEPFVDNAIDRGKSIAPELMQAIRGSKIAVVLLSRNYASSSWCLNELVEIITCREELGQIVTAIFYGVDPTEVKKQTGEFGKVFRKTCKGKAKKEIGRWRWALAQVAVVAGYHSRNWDNEATMIETITSDISNKLNNSKPSNDFDGLIGMRGHLEKMIPLLCLNSDEVKMIGIWGPSGIGKNTIARFLFKQYSDSFHLSVFMENVKAITFTRPVCSDDYSTKLVLHKQLMSRILHQKDIEIPHLGVAQERLKDKRVLIVLDDVDKSVQLEAMAKETRWFGPGSRIIITTQDKRILRAHGVEDVYKVDFPEANEALQIFCMSAFGQNSPKDGFEELSWEITRLVGMLPLGLKVMGSYLRHMSKHEWRNELPMFRNHLNGEIESILKISYDALTDEEKDLFLHIACFKRYGSIEELVELLIKRFWDVRRQLHILHDRSLIDMNIIEGYIGMENLVQQLGIEIVRKWYGGRRFLVDVREICDDLTHTTDSVVGIDIHSMEMDPSYPLPVTITKRAFEEMHNLEFLSLNCGFIDLPQGMDYLSPKLQLLDLSEFPMTCLPTNFRTDCLVKLNMPHSELEKLWDGIQPLKNLKWMNLKHSRNLKELPNLSTAINLQKLNVSFCLSLVELPFSIGYATNLEHLHIRCTNLVELPYSIGNLQKLETMYVKACSFIRPTSSSRFTENYFLPLKNLPPIKEMFYHPEIQLNFSNRFMLNNEFRDLNIMKPSAVKSMYNF